LSGIYNENNNQNEDSEFLQFIEERKKIVDFHDYINNHIPIIKKFIPADPSVIEKCKVDYILDKNKCNIKQIILR
jgi:hypothetical protein